MRLLLIEDNPELARATVERSLTFPDDHPCRSVVFTWEAIIRDEYMIEMELVGTSQAFYTEWFDVYLGHFWRWMICSGRNVKGNGGPISFTGNCNIKIKY